MAEHTKSIDIVVSEFKNAGWQKDTINVSYRPLQRGQFVRCIDPRYRFGMDPRLLGPASPGGTIGTAYFMQRPGQPFPIEEVVSRTRAVGFEPGTHGDFTNGEVRGCKMLYALTQGLLEGEKFQRQM